MAMLDEYGLLSIFSTQDGALRKRWHAPELGQVAAVHARFAAARASAAIAAASMRFDLDGKPLWQTRLGQFNELLGPGAAALRSGVPRLHRKALAHQPRRSRANSTSWSAWASTAWSTATAEAADGWQGPPWPIIRRAAKAAAA